jgi:hypothetical protein
LATTSSLAQEKTSSCFPAYGEPSNAQIMEAFGKQGIRMNSAEAQGVRPNVLLALGEAHRHGLGNSKVDFAAVEIGQDLKLDMGPGSGTVKNITAAIGYLLNRSGGVQPWSRTVPPPPPLAWETYFNETTNLWNQPDFMNLMARNQFHPVKISWEDIGRSENSVWGDRISDVGIWVRQNESDPSSAKLALSVRRDSNFRDKVLMVPADRIKIHRSSWGRVVEKTLPERLLELGLASKTRDRNVIVSNQFAIVPVPAHDMRGAWPEGVPPRAAFNFSIFPYGSTNFVITDVIEGSHEAIVGPGTHQMLFANIHGQKAPFTASRAEDRQDLLQMERDLKAKGMDVDVQRYYLIQIPLRRDARSIQLSNMGTPPLYRAYGAAPSYGDENDFAPMPLKAAAGAMSSNMEEKQLAKRSEPGLDRVAIGHGDAEGAYFVGSGYQGARADEPIRVTVVYFVTPVGKVTAQDMEIFAKAFSQWDSQAIWGGQFRDQGIGLTRAHSDMFGRLGGFHAVAAKPLGRIHGFVSALQEGGERLAPVVGAQPQTDGRPHSVALVVHLNLPDAVPQLFRHDRGILQAGFGQQHEEFLPTPARTQVVIPQCRPQGGRDGLEEQVPRLVAEGIVDALEAVHVGHDQTQGQPAAHGPAQLRLEPLHHLAPVGQTCQIVGAGGLLQGGVHDLEVPLEAIRDPGDLLQPAQQAKVFHAQPVQLGQQGMTLPGGVLPDDGQACFDGRLSGSGGNAGAFVTG